MHKSSKNLLSKCEISGSLGSQVLSLLEKPILPSLYNIKYIKHTHKSPTQYNSTQRSIMYQRRGYWGRKRMLLCDLRDSQSPTICQKKSLSQITRLHRECVCVCSVDL